MRQLGARIVEDPHGAEFHGRTGGHSYWLGVPFVAVLAAMLALGAAYPRKASPPVQASPSASATPQSQPTTRPYATLPPLITPAPTPFLAVPPLTVSQGSIWRLRVADAQPGYPFAVRGKRIYFMGGPEGLALMTIEAGRDARRTTLASVDQGFEVISLAALDDGVIALERQVAACTEACAPASRTPVSLRVLLVRPDATSRLMASYSLVLPSEDAISAFSKDSVLSSRPRLEGAPLPGRASTIADPLRPLVAAAGDRWAISLPMLIKGHWQTRIEFWDLQRLLWTTLTAEPAMRLSVGGDRVAAVLRSPDLLWQLVLAESGTTGLQVVDTANEATLSADGRYLAWNAYSGEGCDQTYVLDLENRASPSTLGCMPGWPSRPAVGSGSRGANVAWIAGEDNYVMVLESPLLGGSVWLPCAGVPEWWDVQGDSIVWASAVEGPIEWAGFNLSSAGYGNV